jgi:hypothetical protein
MLACRAEDIFEKCGSERECRCWIKLVGGPQLVNQVALVGRRVEQVQLLDG